ncbi:hypothetical protein B5P44_31505 [Mycobacterium sp. CBMA 213]|nr:hypothetical protein [Mycolicibacterium sp. CBMA 213]
MLACADGAARLAIRTLGGRVVAGVRERAGTAGAVEKFHDRNPRAVLDELDGIAAPFTPLGVAHDSWVRRCGLPYGLQGR